ncbi:MAG: DUF3499 family protein [Actinomycetota bacterium]
MRLCSKPSCHQPASALLAYDYAARLAVLHDAPEGEVSPHLYELCFGCADKLVAPRGWLLDDRRSEPRLFLKSQSSLV